MLQQQQQHQQPNQFNHQQIPDQIPVDQIPLQGDFGRMTENQGSLQVPINMPLPRGLGQGQQTEFFNDNIYTVLIVLVLWVLIVSMNVPNKIFKTLGIYSLVNYDSDNLTIIGACFVASLTIIVYFLANFMSKK